MAVDLKQFKKLLDNALKEFSKPSTMEEVGKYAANRIVLRTRLGGGATESGDTTRLKKLSDSYKAQRRGKLAFFKKDGVTIPYKPKTKPVLHPDTTPGKSNLTFTGQMLDSVKVISATVGKAIVSVSGDRKDGKTNKDVAGYVSVERPFLNLSKPELNGLQKFIAEILTRKLR